MPYFLPARNSYITINKDKISDPITIISDFDQGQLSKDDVPSSDDYSHQRRPTPPLCGLPLSINKIYRRMYSNGITSSTSDHGRTAGGGVILRQYLIPKNENSRLYQLYKQSPPSHDDDPLDRHRGCIPLVGSPTKMGAFLDKPRTEKSNESGQGAGLRYGIAAMQGWRIEMEDAHTARAGADLPAPWTDWAFFAVFDGHAGNTVARHCSTNLLESIWQTDEMNELAKELPLTKLDEKHTDSIVRAMRRGFLSLDERMRRFPEFNGENERSGSTCVCALISPSHLFLGNLGDSRALISRNGQVHFATEDHKPYLPKERDRILNAGGSVMIQRVNGSLAVSRALGDYDYKSVPGIGPCQQLVSPEPDIQVLERDLLQGGDGKDEFLVMACDGVFDVMNNNELCDFVRSRLRITDRLELICNQILDSCLSKGSKDNMSVILVTFPGAPQISNEAVDKERELEERLKERINGIVNDDWLDRNKMDTDFVLKLLMDQEIPGVPPGAGLHAMRPVVESILESTLRASGARPERKNDSERHQASDSPAPSSPLSGDNPASPLPPAPVSPSSTSSSPRSSRSESPEAVCKLVKASAATPPPTSPSASNESGHRSNASPEKS